MLPVNRVADLGQASLLLALVAAAYAVGASVAGARRGSRRLERSGLYAAWATTAIISFASALIFFSILSNDYSIKYVHHNSDASMPWYYKLTSFWGGLDGSMMFWALLLALFSSVALYVNRERHRELMPYVTAILFTVVGFFLMLIIFEKRPFDVFLAEAPKTGKGLNPLLQNPYMATHPPSLYLGFVSATVPFAFGLAALITGNLDDSWMVSVRRWVLISWYFLSQGLVLGALWAYEVLGWGGFWGWDPVENAGLLPWLTSTAFLHSVMIQERRGMLKVWNVCLVITTFLLTMIGTFMTRSGIVQSVHAFGQDNELAVIFLVWIGVITVFSFGLVMYRLPLLRSRNELDSWISREFAFLINNWILLSAAFFVLTATLFPTLSEWVTGQRITVGPPFFNKWMTPIGLVLLFLTGVGPLIAWRKASVENLKSQFAWPLTGALVTTAVLACFPRVRVWSPFISDRIQLPVSLICFGMCAFVLTTIAQEFYRGTRVRQVHTRLDFFTSLVGLVARNKRRYGGYLVHVAIVLMFFGFAGGSYKQETDATLERGQSVTLGRYNVRFDGMYRSSDAAKDMLTAQLTVFVGGKEYARMSPAKWSYRHHEDEPPTTQVEIHRTGRDDLYLVLNGNEGQLANIKVVINPLVNWIWIGFVLLALGTGIALTPERAYALAGATAKETAKAGATIGMMLVLLAGIAGVARAQNSERPMARATGGQHYARSERERALFGKVVCTCPTCARELLSECQCGVAAQMRGQIQQLIDAGKSDGEILEYEVRQFGDQRALAVPLDKGFNRVAWALPYAGLVAAVGFLVLLARKWTRRRAPAETRVEPAVIDDEKYATRLDDALDDLD